MSGGHKHRYKNVGLSADELRRRREEEGVQLRKQKREQQLFKRRNVNLPGPNTPDIALQVSSCSNKYSIDLKQLEYNGLILLMTSSLCKSLWVISFALKLTIMY